MKSKLIVPIIVVIVSTLTGCTTMNSEQTVELSKQLEQQRAKNENLTASLAKMEESVKTREAELRQIQQNSLLQVTEGTGAPDLPANAKPGECFARVLVPPVYKTSTEEVLKSAASEKIEVIPAKYITETEKVQIKETSETAELIPAQYEWIEEKILVKEASEKLVSVAAEYGTVTEKILVKPAYTTWKKGRGPIERIDHATGEIMCMVEVPAEYKIVSKRVVKTPATIKSVSIPAEYKAVKRSVMVEPPKMVKSTIPAEFAMFEIRKVISPAQEKRIEIPAQYETISKREKVTDNFMEWRPILCEVNATPSVISSVQQALLDEGLNPGQIDGVLGWNTLAAVKSYQQKKGLARGQLTIETVKALGVSLGQ